MLLIDLLAIAILIAGISTFRSPQRARLGNLGAAAALTLAVALVFYRHNVTELPFVLIGAIIGISLGWVIAVRVTMIQIPAMIAFQHGAGAVAAFLVAYVELTRSASDLSSIGRLSAILGLAIGAATFSASMVASAKLANKLRSAPLSLRHHSSYLTICAILILAAGFCIFKGLDPAISYYAVGIIFFAVITGVLFSIRIGAADMPVLISFLNATAGLAAAFCGITIQNRLLMACGAVVAASGSVLTHVMCRAMNRNLNQVLAGFAAASESPANPIKEVTSQPTSVLAANSFEHAIAILQAASQVIVVPGYGMALAQAQYKVVELTSLLEKQGKQIKFAIHPVAGRMPGHMHVLLAAVDIPYDMLFEMDAINEEFEQTDLALVVGANDVVNPAASTAENTPIYGMPILLAGKARHVIVCNLDDKPGYAGVPNSLYKQHNTVLLQGNASETLQGLLASLSQG